MLTQDQVDAWSRWEPDARRPFIYCPMGSGRRTTVMQRISEINLGESVRVIAVARTRLDGEMLRKIGFEWVNLKKPKEAQPHMAVVTIHGLPKLYPLNPGDWLIATDWRMLADRKTKVFKTFFTSTRQRRFCLANGVPHVWATWNVAQCLGVADRVFRRMHDFHASRHADVSPNFITLREPDQEARTDIINYFRKFMDTDQ